MATDNESQSFKDRIANLDAIVAKQNQTISKLRYDNACDNDNLTKLKARFKHAEELKDYFKKGNTNLQKKFDDLASEKNKFDSSFDTIKSYNIRLIAKEVEAMNKVKELECKITSLQNDKKKLMQEDYEAKLYVLQMNNDELNQNISDIKKETNEKSLWKEEKSKKKISDLEEENIDLKKKLSDFQFHTAGFYSELKKHEEKAKASEIENANLKKKIFAVESCFAKAKEEYLKSAQKVNVSTNKDSEEKKRLELRNIKLSNQVSDFEKILFVEKENFEKQKKVFESKAINLSNKITDLETSLEKERKDFDSERKEFEKMKVESFQSKCIKDDFERERGIFKNEMSKLTSKLADLSLEIMKEKRYKSNLQKKFDLNLKEKNVFAKKLKEFEAKVAIVGSSGFNSPDTIDQSQYDDSADSECSYKTASSSMQKHALQKRVIKSNIYIRDQIKPSNLFYDPKLDKSESISFKKVKMEWRVKGSTSEKKVLKSSAHVHNDKKNKVSQANKFVKPNLVYSINELIRLSRQKLCCSSCRTNDFMNKNHVHSWYGTYYVSSNATAPNKSGPKFKWVPKIT